MEGSQNVTKLALFGSRHESEKIARNRQRPVVNRRPLDRELKDDSIVRSHRAQDIKQKTMSNPRATVIACVERVEPMRTYQVIYDFQMRIAREPT